MTLRFGTDGVRGVANVELTPELVLAFGRAAARVLGAREFVIGRDTRQSGPLLESALIAGLAAEGATARTLGIVPTPAVAWAARQTGSAGAMISASHNPFPDNGVKLFDAGGRKLTDEVEERLEAELAEPSSRAAPVGDAVGTAEPAPELGLGWTDSVILSIEGRDLEPLRVVLDCGNGAASVLGPHVLRSLGAGVEVIHARPDGRNINAGCGSTDPSALVAAVVDQGADAGLAFDGDADRVIAVAADGSVLDGDQILAVCALDRAGRGRLPGDAVVVTVMSNLGFRQAMREHGIAVVETPVGDRYVLDAMEQKGLQLGGEQSGHAIFLDLATTGDGVLTAVQLLDVVARTGRPLHELAAVMTRLPQVLRNVKAPASAVAAAAGTIEAVASELGERGRVLVRPSGTEPVVRVMVEAPSTDEAEAGVRRISEALAQGSGQ